MAKKILIIDDDRIIQDILAESLRRFGYDSDGRKDKKNAGTKR